MKVYLIAKDDSGKTALNKILTLWKGRHRFRILRIMGNRVNFSKTGDNPLTLQYSQVDFNNLPVEQEYCRRVKLNAYSSLETYGVTSSNTEIEFK